MYTNWGFIGVREWLGRRLLHHAPRRTTCPACSGSGACPFCEGKGCAQCSNDGKCAQCHGEGNFIIGSGSASANG